MRQMVVGCTMENQMAREAANNAVHIGTMKLLRWNGLLDLSINNCNLSGN